MLENQREELTVIERECRNLDWVDNVLLDLETVLRLNGLNGKAEDLEAVRIKHRKSKLSSLKSF